VVAALIAARLVDRALLSERIAEVADHHTRAVLLARLQIVLESLRA
jgi:hypothetical protein